MQIKNMKLFNTLLVALYCYCQCIYSQEASSFPKKPKTEVKKPSCEFNTLELSTLSQHSDLSNLIIIVSHLGVSEKNKFAIRRLANARLFLTLPNQESRRDISSIILSEGEKVIGLGYLDFYVKGELELRIYISKNKDLFLSDCILNYPDEKACSTDYSKQFYPCKNSTR
jgi:hypothetical protein